MSSSATLGPMVPHPSMPRTMPRFAIPDLACDSHVHVFGPYQRFPLSPGRSYTPPEAPLEALETLLGRLGLGRVVIVQPSIYGADNTVTLDAVRRFGERARAVAVIDESTTGEQLADMHQAGVRGVRINLLTSTEPAPEAAAALIACMAEKIAPLGWRLQLFVRLGLIAQLLDLLASLPVRVVLDHFGWAQSPSPQREIDAMCALVESGAAYVKLSAAYRLSEAGFDDPAVAALARRLIAVNPHALVWGSDWPHPVAFAPQAGGSPMLHDIDDGFALNKLAEWAGDEATLKAILVDNPARLYDFR